MITQDAFTLGESLISTILRNSLELNKRRRKFILHILLLFLSHRGRMNFLQMERQGTMNEKSYRNQFEQPMDWLSFNKELVQSKCSDEIIIGFDPSYISKSGKNTPELGYFYSGCAAQYKRGLEIGCFAAIDIKQNTAYHLVAKQTPSAKRDRINEDKTLTDHYGDLVVELSRDLLSISKVLVCDAYFSKIKFVNKVCDEVGFEFISRLRDDANLKYLYTGNRKSTKGRPRLYNGKINVKKIDKRIIRLQYENDAVAVYSGIVKSVGLKRIIRLCYVEYKHLNGKVITKLYYSTNVDRDAKQILEYYQGRYQMEFPFRDAKQFLGLDQCQARSKNKLDFHFNASLTSVSIGKLISRHEINKDTAISISIADIQTELQNRNMVFRIFSIYGISHKLIKMGQKYLEVLNFGKIAA